MATLTGSSTEGTPASRGHRRAASGAREASRLASTTRAPATASEAGHDGEVGHGQLVGGAHVGDRDVQVAAIVEHGGVGAGGVPRGDEVPAVDPGGGGARDDAVTRRVVAHGGQEGGGAAETGEVLGDVAAHSPGRPRRRSRVARPDDRRRGGPQLGVEHRAPDDDDAGRRRRVFARVGHRSRLEERGALLQEACPGTAPHGRARPGTGTPFGVPVPGGAVRMPVTRA